MNNYDNIGRQLRRLAQSADNRRHLQALPQFQVEEQMPSALAALLRRLDETERAGKR